MKPINILCFKTFGVDRYELHFLKALLCKYYMCVAKILCEKNQMFMKYLNYIIMNAS